MTPALRFPLIAVMLLVGCPGAEPGPAPADVPDITLPPPLVGRTSDTSPTPAAVDPEMWQLTPPSSLPPGAPWLRLFYGQDLRAELEACGCPGAPTGGFSRRATVLAQLRSALPDSRIVEGPNALTRSLTGMQQFKPQERARARLIIELLGTLGVQGYFPGQSDLEILPPRELAPAAAAAGLPVVVSNLDPRVMPLGWKRSLTWEVQGRKVLVLGLLGNPRTEAQTRLTPVTPPAVAVAAARQEAGAVDVVVAFTSAEERERRGWDDGGELGVDVLLVPFLGEERVPERWRDDRYEIAADPLGRALRRLDVVLTGKQSGVRRQPDAEIVPRALASQEESWLRLARRRQSLMDRQVAGDDPREQLRGYDDVVRVDPSTDPAAVQADLAALVLERDANLAQPVVGSTPRHVAVAGTLVLPPDVPEDPEIVRTIEAYQEKWLGELEQIVAAAKAEGDDDGRLYAGVDVCVACHPSEYGQWGRTAHVSAYKTLRERAEHRNPDCLTCHSTGFGKPGGFADPSKTLSLLNVQCEACHGPMALHARQAGSGSGSLAPPPGRAVTEATCKTCHDPANSPAFDYETYHPRIAHGRARPRQE